MTELSPNQAPTQRQVRRLNRLPHWLLAATAAVIVLLVVWRVVDMSGAPSATPQTSSDTRLRVSDTPAPSPILQSMIAEAAETVSAAPSFGVIDAPTEVDSMDASAIALPDGDPLAANNDLAMLDPAAAAREEVERIRRQALEDVRWDLARRAQMATPVIQLAGYRWESVPDAPEPAEQALSGSAPQQSPVLLRAGTVIPAVLINGVDSGLDGTLIAQVSTDVYDTDTGRRIVIPEGSRLVGGYQSGTVLGQKRLGVVWHEVQRPGGGIVPLEAEAGVDRAGFAGFSDQIDNRYWSTFGNATLLGLISGGFQASQSDTNRLDTSTSERMADAIGQQYSQLGAELVRARMDAGPILRVRPGYRFSVMVSRPLRLKESGV